MYRFFCIIARSSHINGNKERLPKIGVTKIGVRSYDELMEGGIFLVEVHIVQKGETLWKISRQFNIPFEELKRKNAHLANPDYIVPGMKIFLPDKTVSKKVEKEPSKVAGVVKKTEKAPEKPAPPSAIEKLEVVEQPIKKPEKPKVPVAPEIPMAQPTQQMPMPQMPPPMNQQMQPQMNQQMQPPMNQQMAPQQFYGVPCGWMPIYDPDCYPYMHSGHMNQSIPMQAPQLPVAPESPMYTQPTPTPMQSPANKPIGMPDGWKLLESPELQFADDIKFVKLPNTHFEESSHQQAAEKVEKAVKQKAEKKEKQVKPVKKEKQEKQEKRVEHVEQPVRPTAPFQQAQMPPQGAWEAYQPYQPYPSHPHQMGGCGPGCGCGGAQMPPPVQHRNYCNACNQPLQAMQNQMMPYPGPNNNWYGTY